MAAWKSSRRKNKSLSFLKERLGEVGLALYRLADAKKLAVKQSTAPLIFSDNLGVLSFNLDIVERLPVIKALFDGTPFSSNDVRSL